MADIPVWVLRTGPKPGPLGPCWARTTDQHSNPRSSFLIVSDVFPFVAFSPLYFCLVSLSALLHVLQACTKGSSVVCPDSEAPRAIHRATTAFPTSEQLHFPHSASLLTVYPCHQKISSVAQGTVLFFVSHGTGSRSKKMSENGMNCP